MRKSQGKHFRERSKLEQNPKVLIETGRQQLRENRLTEAINTFNRACQAAPLSFSAWMGLGDAYLEFGKAESAKSCYLRAINIDGNNGKATFNYAASLMALGDYEGAIDFYQQAAKLNSGLGEASTAAIAEIHERKGQPERAFNLLKPFLEADNPSTEIAGALAQLVSGHKQYCSFHARAVSLLEAVLEAGEVKNYQRVRYLFLLGNLYRKEKDFAKSFEYFAKAHELSGEGVFDLNQFRRNISILKKRFESLNPIETLPDKFKNIFVVGLPRSGSSLVDKIISVNPEVVSLGECNFFHHAVCETVDDEYVMWGCEPLGAPKIPRIKTLYRQKYLAGNFPSRYACDKSLENVFLVGQVLQVFPEARIVWTKRDLRDLCLSCYTSNFFGRHGYVHDLETLARYAKMIEDLMMYWCRQYPHNIRLIEYEELVTSPKNVIRALTDFLGFKWSDAYLNFHKVGYQVKTLSYLDVNEPIYDRAVGKWKAYRQFLEPLLEALDSPREEEPVE